MYHWICWGVNRCLQRFGAKERDILKEKKSSVLSEFEMKPRSKDTNQSKVNKSNNDPLLPPCSTSVSPSDWLSALARWWLTWSRHHTSSSEHRTSTTSKTEGWDKVDPAAPPKRSAFDSFKRWRYWKKHTDTTANLLLDCPGPLSTTSFFFFSNYHIAQVTIKISTRPVCPSCCYSKTMVW